MTDAKSERLGLRGTLALFESALRLIGGANATGLLAAGVAYHSFNADAQEAIKAAGILFLLGVLGFTVAYVGWFVMSLDIDSSMWGENEEKPPYPWFQGTKKSIAEHRQSAKRAFILMALAGMGSLLSFLIGFLQVTGIALRL